MVREIKCKVCGKPVIAYSSRTMYCDDCGPAARLKKKREYARKAREMRVMEQQEAMKAELLHTCDSPARIALCLSCTKVKCTGMCETLRNTKVR